MRAACNAAWLQGVRWSQVMRVAHVQGTPVFVWTCRVHQRGDDFDQALARLLALAGRDNSMAAVIELLEDPEVGWPVLLGDEPVECAMGNFSSPADMLNEALLPTLHKCHAGKISCVFVFKLLAGVSVSAAVGAAGWSGTAATELAPVHVHAPFTS